MTPQERQQVTELFERLSQLENAPREREAEDLIARGLQHVPHAPYALIQTVLIQEEALARANARIQELEGRAGGMESGQPGGFLDSLRGAFAGQPAAPRRGSVPSTRGGSAPMGVPPAFRQSAAPAAGQQQEMGRGGSFLGQAASIVAGVLVGSMAADMLRGQFGSQAGDARSQQADAQNEAQTQQASADDHANADDAGYETADFDDGGGFDFG